MSAKKSKTTLKPNQIEIYDTTLRDGSQAEGVAFSLNDKLVIAEKLDELGVDYIEGGYPLSNEKDVAFFKEIRKRKLKNSRVCAFGMTRRKNIKPENDTCLIAMQKSLAPIVTIVAKGWDMQVKTVLNASLDENLKMTADSISFLRKKGREIFLDLEHFFDGYKENPEYSMKVLMAGAEAGATRIILCDTNGGSLEEDLSRIIDEVSAQIDIPLGIHCHNDSGIAVAGSLAAVRHGAVQIQGTINGFGERCGNADLCPIIANLALKMNKKVLIPNALTRLTEVSRFVYETANLNRPLNQPYVGNSSFAHKGGMHVHAIQKRTDCYEHVSPESVGNSRRIIISELSGASNLLAKNEKLAMLNDKALVRKILNEVQKLENEGYQFETADGSFDLLVRRFTGGRKQIFDLDHYRVISSRDQNGKIITEASVKVTVNGKIEHRVAEGDGPVNALDAALRKCLQSHYPVLCDMQLVDYRVRVVNPSQATAAKVRVVIQSKDSQKLWGTIGVSENIIEASWNALIDSFEYKIIAD